MDMNTRTIFNPAQQYMLQLMADVKDDKTLCEIRDLLSLYFAEKALSVIDKRWDEGELSQEVMNKWLNDHQRTPYL